MYDNLGSLDIPSRSPFFNLKLKKTKECPLGTFLRIPRFLASQPRRFQFSNRTNIPIGNYLVHYPQNKPQFEDITMVWYGFSKPSISRPSYSLPRTYAEYQFLEFDQYYKTKYFIKLKYFFDQAAPRFELGIKDLQSPALPLGHAAKKSERKSRKEEVFIHVFLRKPLLF